MPQRRRAYHRRAGEHPRNAAAVLASRVSEPPSRGTQMTTWTDLLFNSPYGLGSLIVIVAMLAIGGFLAWFLVTRSR